MVMGHDIQQLDTALPQNSPTDREGGSNSQVKHQTFIT